jgi:ubiquinone/menaquinone biosynthesis C-methylase UbiE
MKSDTESLGQLILGMRAVYAQGDNAMAWARANSAMAGNELVSTLVAYDLQAGSYVAYARENSNYVNKWCIQLADLIKPYLEQGDKILEVGVGEATTQAGVIKAINCDNTSAFGLDVSWSRIKVGKKWVEENDVDCTLFVGDMFNIPMADNSIDVVYTSHSLEPNGGREDAAIKELLRVARKAVLLVEPLYELAPENAQKRMTEHGYVRNLKSTAERLGASVVEYGLLDIFSNPLNPSGVVLMVKSVTTSRRYSTNVRADWQCPLTGVPLIDQGDVFHAEQVGVVYPVMRGVPLLRAEHGVVASKLFG